MPAPDPPEFPDATGVAGAQAGQRKQGVVRTGQTAPSQLIGAGRVGETGDVAAVCTSPASRRSV
jgi:hypothetical protein